MLLDFDGSCCDTEKPPAKARACYEDGKEIPEYLLLEMPAGYPNLRCNLSDPAELPVFPSMKCGLPVLISWMLKNPIDAGVHASAILCGLHLTYCTGSTVSSQWDIDCHFGDVHSGWVIISEICSLPQDWPIDLSCFLVGYSSPLPLALASR